MSNEAKVLIGISIATLVIVIGGALFFGGTASQDTASNEPIENREALVREDSHTKGAENGKVTLVEFGDFQCPACGASHPIIKQLMGEYGDRVTFVFRNFPLQMHQNADVAHMAAEAAGEQGKFFEMHDLLFENQAAWESTNDPMPLFTEYAEELDLDVDQFTEAVKSNKFEDKIQQDIDDGYAVGVSSTPTFFINGVKQSGGLPYAEFKQKIEEALQASE